MGTTEKIMVQIGFMLIVLVVSSIVMKRKKRSREEIRLVAGIAVLMTVVPLLVNYVFWPLFWP
ncbi:hypothetical protein [Saccharibacillus brassicae]|uniref:Uncharacterized protein n=1 Tax=Saccharibacillus brassicae TaxID=2583377 RepID=A0A4Y6V147_SACBS|nr:hypothetical protein [Saccharibacillus brassicae]QDH23094.1 hypothetical protein FFV09_20895 [Saccharibacillus brassicae]